MYTLLGYFEVDDDDDDNRIDRWFNVDVFSKACDAWFSFHFIFRLLKVALRNSFWVYFMLDALSTTAGFCPCCD